MSQVLIRPLEERDLAAAQSLSQGFAWPHRLEDWAFMRSVGHGFAADLDGRLVGTGMGWVFGADWAAMGSMMVAPAAQGHGIGRRLADSVLAAVGDRNVVLHATAAGEKLYSALGFTPYGIVRQQQGAAFGAGVVALAPGERLRPIGRSDPASLLKLDRQATGMDRGTLLRPLFDTATGVALDRDGAITGFALLRRFGRGLVIGPVIAPDADRARALIGHFLASRSGEFIRIDVPEGTGLCPWLAQLGLSDAGPVTRMVRGHDVPPPSTARSFALISQSFG